MPERDYVGLMLGSGAQPAGESSEDADAAEARSRARGPSRDYIDLLTRPYVPAVSAGEGRTIFQPEEAPNRYTYPKDDPQRYAGVLTQAGASLPTDLTARARYFAQQRFPGMKPQEALDKYYGIKGGRVFFYDPKSGHAFYEEPGAGAAVGARGLAAIAPGIASNAGPSLPLIGATAGTIATGPAGPASIAGAGGGAAAGDLARQALARAVTGEERDLADRALQTGSEAVLGAGGQALGLGAVRVLNRNAARDLARLSDPRSAVMAGYLQQAAGDEGISLTPAEITNLRSLRGQQEMIGESTRAGDELQRFIANRNETQVPRAVDRMLGRLSPEASTEAAGAQLQAGGEAAIGMRQGQREAAASPLYQRAFQGPDLPEDAVQSIVDQIDRELPRAKGEIRQALEKARGYFYREESYIDPRTGKARTRDVLDTSVEGLHNAKLAIDAQIAGRGENAISGVTQRRLVELQRNLAHVDDDGLARGILPQHSPEYAEGMANFRAASPAVEELTQGPVGLAANLEGDRPRAAAILFDAGRIGPQGIARARQAYEQAGRLDDWNAGARAWLQENWSQAARDFQSGNPAPGAKFRAAIFGSEPQREALRAALSPEQYAYALRLFDVLEATGRAVPRNSTTAYKIEAINEAKDQAGGITAAVFRNANPLDWGRHLGQWWQEVQYGRHMEDLAAAITSPTAMQDLAALKRLPARSQAAVQFVARKLVMSGGEAGLQGATRMEDRAPGQPWPRSAAGGR